MENKEERVRLDGRQEYMYRQGEAHLPSGPCFRRTGRDGLDTGDVILIGSGVGDVAKSLGGTGVG